MFVVSDPLAPLRRTAEKVAMCLLLSCLFVLPVAGGL